MEWELSVIKLCFFLFFSSFLAAENTTQLENGFIYTLKQQMDTSNKVEFRLIINTGSLSENDEERGYAHLLEHMAFNGTKHFPKQSIRKLFRQAGLNFGHDLNAITYMDRTVYTLSLPKNNKHLIEQSLIYFSDILSEINFNQAELDLEKNIVINEHLDTNRKEKSFLEAAFSDYIKGSLYEKRQPTGKLFVVKNAQVDSLNDFYNKWYRPNNAKLLIVGDIDKRELEKSIKQYFASTPKTNNKAQQKVPLDPAFTTKAFIHSSKVVNTAQTLFLIDLPSITVLNKADAVKLQQRKILAEIISYRLNNANGNRIVPFPKITVTHKHLLGKQSLFAFHIYHKINNHSNAVKFIAEELARLKAYGFTQEEFELQLAFTKMQQANLKSNYANLTTKQVANYIVNSWALGAKVQNINFETEVFNILLKEISLDVLNQLFISSISRPSKMLYAYPINSIEPDSQKLQALFTKISKNPSQKQENKPNLFTDLPSQKKSLKNGKIKSEKYYSKIGITSWQLDNGVNVLLRPDKSANGRVYIKMAAPGGLYSLKENQIPLTSLFISAYQQSGLASLSALQLHQNLKSNDVSMSSFIEGDNHGFNFELGKQSMELSLFILRSAFISAKLDNKAFTNVKNSLIEQHKYALNQKSTKANQELLNKLYPNSSYDTVLSLEQLNLINYSDLTKLHEQLFSSANGYQMTLVGDFNIDEVKPLIKSYIGSLPSGKRQKYAQSDKPFITKNTVLTVYANPYSRANLTFFYIFNKSDRTIDEIYAADLISRILRQRLMDIVREKLSLTYSPMGGCISKSPGYPYAGCNISLTIEPENIDKAKKSVESLVAKLVHEGVSDKELVQNKLGLVQDIKNVMKSAKDSSFYFQKYSLLGFSIDSISRPDEVIDRIDTEYINKLLKTYFNKQQSLIFINLPEK